MPKPSPVKLGRLLAKLDNPTKQNYIRFQNKAGLQPGEKVTVTRPARNYENGWRNHWIEGMDQAVGKTYTIKRTCNSPSRGIRLQEIMELWPFFVLQRINH